MSVNQQTKHGAECANNANKAHDGSNLRSFCNVEEIVPDTVSALLHEGGILALILLNLLQNSRKMLLQICSTRLELLPQCLVISRHIFLYYAIENGKG